MFLASAGVSALTAANQLTLLRMLLIPAFVILVLYGEFPNRSMDLPPLHTVAWFLRFR